MKTDQIKVLTVCIKEANAWGMDVGGSYETRYKVTVGQSGRSIPKTHQNGETLFMCRHCQDRHVGGL